RREEQRKGGARKTGWRPSLEEPHEGQKEVLEGAAAFNVLCMGHRWGKTRLSVRLIAEPLCAGYPVGLGVPEYAKAAGVWRELKDKLEPITKYKNDSLWELETITGGFFKVFPLDRNPDGPRSFKFRRFIVDEAAFCKKLKEALEDSILPTLADDPDSDLWLLSSSRGKNTFWNYWKRGEPGGGEQRAGWRSWRKPTNTNPHISAARLAQLRAEVSERKAAVQYDASFDVGGLFFDDWQESKSGRDWHVCTPFAVPPWWIATGGMDFGKNNFACHINRWDEDGNCFIVREVTLHNAVPSEQAVAVVKALEDEGLKPSEVVIYADPSGFPPINPKERRGQYDVEAFWSVGLRVEKAENDRQATNGNAAEWLRDGLRETDSRAKAGRLDEITEGQSFPRVRVFRGRCPDLVRTIPLMEPLPDNLDDFDSDGPDHWVDSGLRYGLRPKSRAPKSKRPTKATFEYLPPEWGNGTVCGTPSRTARSKRK
ncbi:hypothetical protein, partial [Armatimonas sp.]|uniref:hypothetical protein n=1 Tax=Armatimonas sp. TaxID=1872638 RepID=UPI0037505F84